MKATFLHAALRIVLALFLLALGFILAAAWLKNDPIRFSLSDYQRWLPGSPLPESGCRYETPYTDYEGTYACTVDESLTVYSDGMNEQVRSLYLHPQDLRIGDVLAALGPPVRVWRYRGIPHSYTWANAYANSSGHEGGLWRKATFILLWSLERF